MDLPEVPAEKTEEFAAQVAADLSPEMSGTFGAIHVEEDGGGRDVWTALGWQKDGSSVYLHIDPSQRSVELRLDTRGLAPPVPRAGWMDWVLIGLVAGSTAVGIALRSWPLTVGLLLLVLGCWLAVGARRRQTQERQRSIDPQAWNERLKTALERAKNLDE